MGKCTDVISIGVARKSEGTIMLKEIVVIFIVLRDCVCMGFRNGSQICLGNDNCIQSNRIWISVCIGSYRMMSFVMICGVNPCSKLPNAMLNQQLAMGICS